MTRRDPGKYVAVTPSDVANLTGGASFGVMVHTAGALKVDYQDGTTETLTVPAGVLDIYGVIKIYATGTTATGISVKYPV